ncbi:MAG: PHP domain-containing protein [Anaerolineales bacterium]|nr:PHP domain-containing protein [Anaerolineales bacterium]
MPELLAVETHCHTYWSKDSLMLPDRLIAVAQDAGLDRLAITDHNAIGGALEAARLAPDFIIVGEEIMTTQGELLAYFVREHIPAGLTPEETIRRLRGQQAAISVAHPYDHRRSGAWKEEDLRRILPLVDAIEAFNSRSMVRDANPQAERLASTEGKPGTAGSDAHSYREVGRSRMLLPPFHDGPSMAQAFRQAQLVCRQSSHAIHLTSRYATWRKLAGWQPPRRG